MKTTPAKFVERLRVEVARGRLEESQNNMETIAESADSEKSIQCVLYFNAH